MVLCLLGTTVGYADDGVPHKGQHDGGSRQRVPGFSVTRNRYTKWLPVLTGHWATYGVPSYQAAVWLGDTRLKPCQWMEMPAVDAG